MEIGMASVVDGAEGPVAITEGLAAAGGSGCWTGGKDRWIWM